MSLSQLFSRTGSDSERGLMNKKSSAFWGENGRKEGAGGGGGDFWSDSLLHNFVSEERPGPMKAGGGE